MSIHKNYTNQKILLVGCGCKPRFCTKDHSNAFTIDIDSQVKPSLVMDISKGTLPLPSNTFNKVIFEGVALRLSESKLLIQELKRVSTKNAFFDIEFFMPGAYRHKRGHWDNYYKHLSPFICFDDILDLSPSETQYILNHKEIKIDRNGYMM